MQDKVITDILCAVEKTLREGKTESMTFDVPTFNYLAVDGTIMTVGGYKASDAQGIIKELAADINHFAEAYKKLNEEKRPLFEVPAYKFLSENSDIISVPFYATASKEIQPVINNLVGHCNRFAEAYEKLKNEKEYIMPAHYNVLGHLCKPHRVTAVQEQLTTCARALDVYYETCDRLKKEVEELKKTKVYTIDSYFTKEGDYVPKVVNHELDAQMELTALVNTANHFREVWQNELRAATNWEKQCEKLRADLESLEKNTLLRKKELAAQLSEFHVSLSDIIDNVY